jgi:hypothetical protein
MWLRVEVGGIMRKLGITLPLRSLDKLMVDFEDWLEFEFPAHSPYDHETLGGYERWKGDLRLAYEAGVKSRQMELQNRITELEEIISGYNETKGSGLGC